jgi:hypothetical protein
MKMAGEVKKMTIAQLREKAPEMSDEEINEIAEKYRNYENNSNSNSLNSAGSYLENTEDYDINVVELEFVDYDLQMYEKKKTSRGDHRYYEKSFDYKKKSTETRQSHSVKKKKIRKVSWVVGTDKVFDFGEQTDIPKNDSVVYRCKFSKRRNRSR